MASPISPSAVLLRLLEASGRKSVFSRAIWSRDNAQNTCTASLKAGSPRACDSWRRPGRDTGPEPVEFDMVLFQTMHQVGQFHGLAVQAREQVFLLVLVMGDRVGGEIAQHLLSGRRIGIGQQSLQQLAVREHFFVAGAQQADRVIETGQLFRQAVVGHGVFRRSIQ